jgi:hypothetical protein
MISDEIEWCKERLQQLKKPDELYNRYEHHDVIYRIGKNRRNTIRLNPTLALAIRDRIDSADIVLIIAGVIRDRLRRTQFATKMV